MSPTVRTVCYCNVLCNLCTSAQKQRGNKLSCLSHNSSQARSSIHEVLHFASSTTCSPAAIVQAFMLHVSRRSRHLVARSLLLLHFDCPHHLTC